MTGKQDFLKIRDLKESDNGIQP